MASGSSTGSIWGGGSSSSSHPSTGVVWGRGSSSAKTTKEKHGVVGFFEHLGSDIKDAAVGLPMGLVNTVRHPIRTSKQTGRVEWQTWSPLVEGHFGKFAHNFDQHPLAPLLDIAAVASLGLGTAARVAETGALGERAAALASNSELKVVGETADQPAMSRTLSRRPAARLRQNLTAAATGRVHPFKSQASLYKDLSSKEATRQQFAMNARMDALAKAYKGLSKPADQRKVFEHIYNVIRTGPSRRVKISNLTDFKPPKGWRFVTEHKSDSLFDHVANPTKNGAGDFEKELYNVHSRLTTTSLADAAKMDGGKTVLVVPDRAVRAYSHEAGASASFIRKAYDKPTKLWRAAVLNMRPAYVVNNAVGNTFMYLMNHSDYTGMRAWVDSVKQVKGTRYVERMADTSAPRWMETHFGDEVGNTFGGSVSADFKSRLGKGVMPLNIKMERMFRRSLINSEMRRSPEVQTFMKRGMDYNTAASKALRNNPGLRARVLEHAHNTLGDYTALSKTDRQIRDLIPFWAWDKTIARHTAKLVDEQPVKAAVAANIGTQGTQSTEKALGEIPDFLKGAIPLSFAFGPSEPGRKSILTTQGLNPYSTIPDLASTLGSFVGIGSTPASEAVGSLIGPIPTVGVESVTGQRFSGAPIPDKGLGPIGNAVEDLLVNLPPSQLVAAATDHLPPSTTIDKRTGKPRQKLYQKDWESIVSSWLGFPTRKMSPDAAANEAATQANQRKTIGLGAI